MSAREWKPGVVAMVTLSEPHPRRGGGPFLMLRDVSGLKNVWRLASTGVVHEDVEVKDVRPLIVLDPGYGKASAVDLIAALRTAAENDESVAEPLQWLAFQIARQTLPPKPDEPSGLGAVVEDASGLRWVRVGPTIGDLHWRREIGDPNCYKWQAIDATRVLCPGWSE